MVAQYRCIAEKMEKRIRFGDYLIKGFPPSRRLAEEMGVSHIVARKAMELLVREGLIERRANGRYTACVSPDKDTVMRRRVAFVAPAFSSPFFELCRKAAAHAARELGVHVRQVDFIHWDDSIFGEVLRAFHGAFIMPVAEQVPRHLAERWAKSRCRVVTFEHDLTEFGVPCIEVFPTRHLATLFSRMMRGSTGRLGCLNVQPEDQVIVRRMDAWRDWAERRGLAGPMINEPMKPYDRAVGHAYEVTRRAIREGRLECGALFVTIADAAKGVIRALHDEGVAVGSSFRVASVDDEGDARFLIPSLTSLELPDMDSLVRQALSWMFEPGASLPGNRILASSLPDVFVGETVTGGSAAPATGHVCKARSVIRAGSRSVGR